MNVAWTAPVPFEKACRRASGRRAYNRLRQDKATIRRIEIIEYMTEQRLVLYHGMQRHLARRFGVSTSTICRDMKWIVEQMQPCPTCGRLRYELDDVDESDGEFGRDPEPEVLLALELARRSSVSFSGATEDE